MRIHRFSLFLLLAVPAIGLAQQTTEQQNQLNAQFQQTNHMDQASQQVQAEQQSLQQQQALQAQQDQANAERDQANTMWQQQMDQERDQNQYGTPAGAAAEGALEITGALITRHREEEAAQAYQAAQDQQDALQRQYQAALTSDEAVHAQVRELKELKAEQDNDIAQLVANDQEAKAISRKLDAIDAADDRPQTLAQMRAIRAKLSTLLPRARAQTEQRTAIVADLSRIQQQVHAIGASNP